MKILFVIPWTKTLFGGEKAVSGHPHLGIAYLSAVLKENKHEVRIFDQAIESNDQKLFELISGFNPDIVGVTVFSYCSDYASEIINQIKKQSQVPVIIGGPHVSAVKARVLEKIKADFALKGEGEISFLEFLGQIGKTQPQFDHVRGLIFRNKKGEIIENGNAPSIQDLDRLPFPDFSEFKFEKYSYFQTGTIPLITSRGCPYSCNYCSVKLSMGRTFRARSPENVIAEIEQWYRLGFTNFEINDDCFSLDLGRAEKICDLLVKKDLKITYQLYNGIRVDKLNEKLLKKMKDSGCVFISYGAESGNQEVINNIGKGITLKQIKKAVTLTNKVGIKNSVNFIIGHPGENYRKAKQTLRLAQKLPTNFVNVYNLIPYPGTDLFAWIEKKGTWLYPPDWVIANIGTRDLKPAFETPEFRKEERIKALREGFSLYEKTILKFRFGQILGTMAYILSRNKALLNLGIKLALGTPLGYRIYNKLTYRSKKNEEKN